MEYEAIGEFHCLEQYPYDAARQGSVSQTNVGTIELYSGQNYEQALTDLEGFTHIWLLYHFNKNAHWKPMVTPPRGSRKVGVFASRAPYRPNAIGMSCVRLGGVSGRCVEVFDHDLLNGTPILDIKPYLAYADSFPDAGLGWLDDGVEESWAVDVEEIREPLEWLAEQHVDRLKAFLAHQLAHEPRNAKKKRVCRLDDEHWEIAYRTWRVRFRVDAASRRIVAVSLYSGYGDVDRAAQDDPYGDKSIHRAFADRFVKLL